MLPKFQGQQVHQFTRKLNRWEFSRVPLQAGAYFHKLFRRIEATLCIQMTSSSGWLQNNPLQRRLLLNVPGGMQEWNAGDWLSIHACYDATRISHLSSSYVAATDATHVMQMQQMHDADPSNSVASSNRQHLSSNRQRLSSNLNAEVATPYQ
jgi:hypothetical protein